MKRGDLVLTRDGVSHVVALQLGGDLLLGCLRSPRMRDVVASCATRIGCRTCRDVSQLVRPNPRQLELPL